MAPDIITNLLPGIFHISNKYRLPPIIQILPANPSDLFLPACRENRERYDLRHVYSAWPTRLEIKKVAEQFVQLILAINLANK